MGSAHEVAGRRAGALAVAGSGVAIWLMLAAGTSVAMAQGAPPSAPPGKATGGAGGEGEEAAKEKPDFPPFKEVGKDHVKVVSFSDEGKQPLYTLYRREKDQQLLAELPANFGAQKHFWAMTIASGDTWAGLQGSDVTAYWKRFDKSLALIQPNFDTRSTGDDESKAGVKQQFSDRVLLDVPIKCMGPGGQPMIDLRELLVGQANRFFGFSAAGANTKLAVIKEVKAFPENIEVSIEMPVQGGQIRTFHYSISKLPETTGYKPREADERVGYFTTAFRDLGKFRDDKKWIRYVNRWQLEKRDPSLKQSPPKEPIVFYIDHKVPVRYRRFVREGILAWNKAYEKVGFLDAIEVYYQDASTGANMEKDPEDVRYNFVRWLANDQGTAIGPSRVDPRTGQILDADIVLTDGWIRYFWNQANELLPEVAMTGMPAQTLAWLERKPQWDPRIRLAPPSQRDYLLAQRAQRGVMRFGGHPAGQVDASAYGNNPFDGLYGRTSQINGLCMAARGKGMDVALMRMHLELQDMLDDEPPVAGGGGDGEKKDDKKDEKKDDKPKKEKDELIDGIPEWFVGPLLADLTAHEVGHTLGLRHNFKASSIYPLKDINSYSIKGEKSFAGSVMDYISVNINMGSGPVQGDYAMRGIGPYDFWAIEYGYGSDPKETLKRVAEPELVFQTDEDVGGPDPLARPYDFGADPLDFANNQMRLVEYYRGRLIEKFVKDGESWAKARRGYMLTLNSQMQCISFMSPWIGGAHVFRDRKGDPNGRPPLQVVPVEKQRAALRFVIDKAFRDEAFGLTPNMLQYMTVDKWWDGGGMSGIFEDATFPVHERILGIQASAMTMVLNPTTLERVYDNEFRIDPGQDMITVPEVMKSVGDAVWTELEKPENKTYTPRQPMISSLRRNLQREHLNRLIDLSLPDGFYGAAAKPVSNLAVQHMRDIRSKIDKIVDIKSGNKKGVDDYTYAHLFEAATRIDKALDAQYIYNMDSSGGFGGFGFFFGRPAETPGAAPQDGRQRPIIPGTDPLEP